LTAAAIRRVPLGGVFSVEVADDAPDAAAVKSAPLG